VALNALNDLIRDRIWQYLWSWWRRLTIYGPFSGNSRQESRFGFPRVGRTLHNVRCCVSQLTNIILLNLCISNLLDQSRNSSS